LCVAYRLHWIDFWHWQLPCSSRLGSSVFAAVTFRWMGRAAGPPCVGGPTCRGGIIFRGHIHGVRSEDVCDEKRISCLGAMNEPSRPHSHTCRHYKLATDSNNSRD